MPEEINCNPVSSIVWLAVVGGTTTLTYAVLAWALTERMPGPAWLASVTAYSVASILSYAGHRRLTFRSRQPHTHEAPRFIALAVVGYGTAATTPLVMTDMLNANPLFAIVATCLIIPVLNTWALSRLVFRVRLLRAHRRAF
jgi:putative flippase GtrA